uniref:NAC transcription factor 20 n=1 Tax=Litchi chinensis TaxID=151069 RepID=A0A8K1MDW7_LITCN|nr:NAC transcription factor 20 [Litchi chinensis]
MAFSCLRYSPELVLVGHEDQDQEELYLPLGYRFAPRNHELVLHYLAKKILDQKLPANIITTVDLYQYDPDQLPIRDFKYGKPNEAYFFSKLEYRQSKGLPRRTTKSGYWKATGRPTEIFYKKTVVGFKKILIFHWGKAPTGKSSPWIMHEFRVNPSLIPATALNNKIRSKNYYSASRSREEDTIPNHDHNGVESYVVCKINYKELEDNKPSKAKSKKITKILEETKI